MATAIDPMIQAGPGGPMPRLRRLSRGLRFSSDKVLYVVITAAVLFIVLGYYLVYYLGILMRARRMEPEPSDGQ